MGYIAAEVFNFPFGNTAYFVLSYAVHFQFLSHAGIAVNRFLVLTDIGKSAGEGIVRSSRENGGPNVVPAPFCLR